MQDILLRIENLKKVYKLKKKSEEALKGVSFDLFSKEIFSLLGVNGAGKTTLSSIIASLIKPSFGDIIYKGKSIYENIDEYRKMIGFCPQFQNLDKDLNVEENLEFAGRYYNLSKEKREKRKEELLEMFELKNYARADVENLSGGYRKRVMIARTLMHDPKILILDEPTVGLDPQVRRQLWKFMLSLKDEGKTIILTTHYLDEADILSDRVCVIDEGEIKTLDKPSNLKKEWKKENLEEVFLHLLKEQK